MAPMELWLFGNNTHDIQNIALEIMFWEVFSSFDINVELHQFSIYHKYSHLKETTKLPNGEELNVYQTQRPHSDFDL